MPDRTVCDNLPPHKREKPQKKGLFAVYVCTVRIYIAKAPKLHVYREERWFFAKERSSCDTVSADSVNAAYLYRYADTYGGTG